MKSLPKLLSRVSSLEVCGLVPSVKNLLPQRPRSLLLLSGLHLYDDQLSVNLKPSPFVSSVALLCFMPVISRDVPKHLSMS